MDGRGSFTGTFKDDEAYDGKLIDKNENSFEKCIKVFVAKLD